MWTLSNNSSSSDDADSVAPSSLLLTSSEDNVSSSTETPSEISSSPTPSSPCSPPPAFNTADFLAPNVKVVEQRKSCFRMLSKQPKAAENIVVPPKSVQQSNAAQKTSSSAGGDKKTQMLSRRQRRRAHRPIISSSTSSNSLSSLASSSAAAISTTTATGAAEECCSSTSSSRDSGNASGEDAASLAPTDEPSSADGAGTATAAVVVAAAAVADNPSDEQLQLLMGSTRFQPQHPQQNTLTTGVAFGAAFCDTLSLEQLLQLQQRRANDLCWQQQQQQHSPAAVGSYTPNLAHPIVLQFFLEQRQLYRELYARQLAVFAIAKQQALATAGIRWQMAVAETLQKQQRDQSQQLSQQQKCGSAAAVSAAVTAVMLPNTGGCGSILSLPPLAVSQSQQQARIHAACVNTPLCGCPSASGCFVGNEKKAAGECPHAQFPLIPPPSSAATAAASAPQTPKSNDKSSGSRRRCSSKLQPQLSVVAENGSSKGFSSPSSCTSFESSSEVRQNQEMAEICDRSSSITNFRHNSHGTSRNNVFNRQHHQQRPQSFSSTAASGSSSNTTDSYISISMMDVLSEKIFDFYQNMAQTTEQLSRKLYLRDYLYYMIAPIYPSMLCGLYLIGSSLNGFGTNHSDMDLCLMISDCEIDQRTAAVNVLKNVMEVLANESSVFEMQLIPAKVPILRITFEASIGGVIVDLNVNNSVAIRNTHLLSYYAQFDWRVCPLVAVIKEWAKRKGINDPSRASFTSYSLVLMMIHYLQCGTSSPVLPSLQKLYPTKFNAKSDIRMLVHAEDLPKISDWKCNYKESLGGLLIGFLRYYSKFDFEKHAISIRRGERVGREQVAKNNAPYNLSQWHFICIEEPFTLTNTAHAIYDLRAFMGIRKAFDEGLYELNANYDLSLFLGPEVGHPKHLKSPHQPWKQDNRSLALKKQLFNQN